MLCLSWVHSTFTMVYLGMHWGYGVLRYALGLGMWLVYSSLRLSDVVQSLFFHPMQMNQNIPDVVLGTNWTEKKDSRGEERCHRQGKGQEQSATVEKRKTLKAKLQKIGRILWCSWGLLGVVLDLSILWLYVVLLPNTKTLRRTTSTLGLSGDMMNLVQISTLFTLARGPWVNLQQVIVIGQVLKPNLYTCALLFKSDHSRVHHWLALRSGVSPNPTIKQQKRWRGLHEGHTELYLARWNARTLWKYRRFPRNDKGTNDKWRWKFTKGCHLVSFTLEGES